MERRDEAVNGYKTIRTSTGHRIRVRMSDEEIAAKTLYNIALVVLPFVSSVLMFWVWVKAV